MEKIKRILILSAIVIAVIIPASISGVILIHKVTPNMTKNVTNVTEPVYNDFTNWGGNSRSSGSFSNWGSPAGTGSGWGSSGGTGPTGTGVSSATTFKNWGSTGGSSWGWGSKTATPTGSVKPGVSPTPTFKNWGSTGGSSWGWGGKTATPTGSVKPGTSPSPSGSFSSWGSGQNSWGSGFSGSVNPCTANPNSFDCTCQDLSSSKCKSSFTSDNSGFANWAMSKWPCLANSDSGACSGSCAVNPLNPGCSDFLKICKLPANQNNLICQLI